MKDNLTLADLSFKKDSLKCFLEKKIILSQFD